MVEVKYKVVTLLAKALQSMDISLMGRALVLESPKTSAHGDFASNIALQLAKELKQAPRTLALDICQQLQKQVGFDDVIKHIDVAGPGFINITLSDNACQSIVREVLNQQHHFGKASSQNRQVMVEFVSANPTGPLHVGHGRQAALGDAICNLFETQGFKVHREFYYNDAGVQISNLAKSVQLRAKGIKPGDKEWPADAYAGDYVIEIAKDYLAQKKVFADGKDVWAKGDVENLDAIRAFAVAYLRNEQNLDLEAFSVKFDCYYLESSLYTTGKVKQTVEKLITAGETYEDGGALWLKTTRYGDDKDRVMRKSDGSYTYFVPDVAYHITKWERGFEKVVNIQGTDHHGTIARVRAGLQAANVGIPVGYPDYVLHTMVRVVRNGEEVKISKRAGSYITLRDLIDWTSKDAVRFFLLSRKPDTEYTFDIDLALAKNNDNPVYYVQYAHARICKMLRDWGGDADQLRQIDLSSLKIEQARALMLQLAKYPEVLKSATYDFAPHDVSFYLRDLASCLHSYYAEEKVLVDDETLKLARLALVAACAQVLANGLAILGVSAPQKM